MPTHRIVPRLGGAMPAQMDDITLLQHFIEGDVALIGNCRLSVQSAQEMVQLLGRHGQLLAWAQHTTSPSRFGVRVGNEYAVLLNQLLLEQEFMPLGLDDRQSFMQYEYNPLPQGYEMNYTQGRSLWKYWWTHRQQLTGPQPELEILVFAHRQWNPVMQVNFQETTLFITTPDGELALQAQDDVVWVHPIESVEDEKTLFFVGPPPASALPSTGPESVPVQPTKATATPLSVSRSHGTLADSPSALKAINPLSYVEHCSEHQLIIETPQGKIVVFGEHLAVHAASVAG